MSTFLSQAFQSTTAATQASVISAPNSTQDPLPDGSGGISFEGAWVSGANYSVIQCALVSDTACILEIVQSFEPATGFGNVNPFVFTYTGAMLDTLKTVFYPITCPFVKVYVTNLGTGNTVFLLSTKFTSSGSVSVSNFPAVQEVSGSVTISGIEIPPLNETTDSIEVFGSDGTNNYALPLTAGGTQVKTAITQSLPAGTNSIGTISTVSAYDNTTPFKLQSVRIPINATQEHADHLLVITNAVQEVSNGLGSSVVSYGFDGDNYRPIQQTLGGDQVKVAVDTALPEGTNSIGTISTVSVDDTPGKLQSIGLSLPQTNESASHLLVTTNARQDTTGDAGSSVVSYGFDGSNYIPLPLGTIVTFNVSQLSPLSGQVKVINAGNADWASFSTLFKTLSSARNMMNDMRITNPTTITAAQIAYGWDLTIWGLGNEEGYTGMTENIGTTPFPDTLPTEYSFSMTFNNYVGTYIPNAGFPGFGAFPEDTFDFDVILNPDPETPNSVVPYAVVNSFGEGMWCSLPSSGQPDESAGVWVIPGTFFNGLSPENDLTFNIFISDENKASSFDPIGVGITDPVVLGYFDIEGQTLVATSNGPIGTSSLVASTTLPYSASYMNVNVINPSEPPIIPPISGINIETGDQESLQTVTLTSDITGQPQVYLQTVTNATSPLSDELCSSVVSYGYDGLQYKPIPLTGDNNVQVKVSVETPLPTGFNSIGSVVLAEGTNSIGSVALAEGTNSIGSVGITAKSFSTDTQIPLSSYPNSFQEVNINQLVTWQTAVNTSGLTNTENSSVVTYGFDQAGNNYYPIPLTSGGYQVKVAVDTALPTGYNSIGTISTVSAYDYTTPLNLQSVSKSIPQTNNPASHLLVITNAVQDTIGGEGSSVVSYGFDGTNFRPISQTLGGNQVKVAVDTALPAGTNSIGSVSLNAALPAGTNTIGSVGLTSSFDTQTYSLSFLFAPISSSLFYDMGDNSLVDILFNALGPTLVTGPIRLDYSADATNWYPNNTTLYTISSVDPYLTIIGLKTGSRYIRVSTSDTSTFRATTLRVVFSSKRS